jgi:methyl-accepting chemotaxis protein
MRITIFAKVAMMTVLAILLTVVPILYLVDKKVFERLDADAKVLIEESANVIEVLFDNYRLTMSGFANQLAHNDSLIKAVIERDKETVIALTRRVLEQSPLIDSIVVTDDKGDVIARAHSDTVGDSVAYQANVQKSLKGQASVGYEGIVTNNTVSLRAGEPVTYRGAVVGTLSIGFHPKSILIALKRCCIRKSPFSARRRASPPR